MGLIGNMVWYEVYVEDMPGGTWEKENTYQSSEN